MDPVLSSYQTAMAELMLNQQMVLAGFLAASAMAHMPIQPELSPIRTPEMPRRAAPGARNKSPATPRQRALAAAAAAKSQADRPHPISVLEQAKLHQQRLRFILERQRASLKRVISLGKEMFKQTELSYRRAGEGFARIAVT